MDNEDTDNSAKKALRLMEEALWLLDDPSYGAIAAHLDLAVNQLKVQIGLRR